jgi:hypothetical protein
MPGGRDERPYQLVPGKRYVFLMPRLHDHLRTLTHRAKSRTNRVPASPHKWSAASEGQRVVVENEDASWQWAATRILETAGYEVACCGGPKHLPHQRCPLVAGDRCPLIEGADLVVNGLGISDPANHAVLSALRTDHGRIPVIAEIPTPQVARLHAEIPGCRTVPRPVGPGDLVAAVDDALFAARGR